MESDPVKAPLAIFAFNRPQTLERTLRALQRCEGFQGDDGAPRAVYAFVDGPRTGHGTDEQVRVDACAETLERFRREAIPQLEIVYRPENIGCAANIRGGIGSVLETHDRIIVVEDDVLASRFFLRYMDAALERYAGDPRIWCVNGWRSRYLNVLARPSDDVALVPRNASSGWGTWRDRWCEVDFSIPGWEVFKADPASMARLVATGADLPGMMEDFWPGRPDVWDVPCTYHMVRHGLFAVEPRLALTKNIGFDGNGLHSRPGDVLLARAPFYDFMPSLPERLAPDPRYLAEWSRALCSLAPSVRIKRKFLRLLWRFGPRHDTPVGQGGF